MRIALTFYEVRKEERRRELSGKVSRDEADSRASGRVEQRSQGTGRAPLFGRGLSEFKFAGSAAFARKNKLLLGGKRLLQPLLGGE